MFSEVDIIINKSNILTNESVFQETSLIIINYFWQQILYSKSDRFGCNFVIAVEKSYGSPVFLGVAEISYLLATGI